MNLRVFRPVPPPVVAGAVTPSLTTQKLTADYFLARHAHD
jgi:hypothetical protein